MRDRILFLVISVLFAGACTQETVLEEATQPEEDVNILLSVNALATNDPMSINQDQEFSSLALYLFNNDATFTLDKSALLPSFSSVATKDIAIETQAGNKVLYLIANYASKTFRLANGTLLTLSPLTSKSQLDQLTTESTGGFSPSSLLMVGKQVLNMSAAIDGTTISILLRRLQARVDVHIYKGPNFGSGTVTLKSVTLYNQSLNSEVKFDYSVGAAQMLALPMFNTQIVTGNTNLSPYTVSSVPQPQDAQAVFYSYQNLVTVFSPLQATAPRLEIKLQTNGMDYTYTGYLTDANQSANKYSLLQNNLYQITAVLDVNAKMQLNMTVLPWNKTTIEYNRPITANDFSFGAWGTSWGGINGKTIHTVADVLEDAVFQFELKAPFGAAWTATLTNGLDFTFTSSTAGTSTTAVSKGFTNVGNPFLIAVRATKRWTGDVRDTEFYITVEGKEVPINPMVGGQRRYDGTDTRIKIKQVASYN